MLSNRLSSSLTHDGDKMRGYASVLVALTALFLIPLLKYFYDPLKLRRFPAASWLAATTPFWCVWNSYRGRRFISIDEAHKLLGPAVRISPTHVSFNDPAAVRDIYTHLNGGKIMKDEFYDNLAGEFHNIANVRNREEHSRKRKYFSHAFALKSIMELEPIVHRYVAELVGRLDFAVENEPGSSLNINSWLNFFTFDVIGEVAVGKSFGFLKAGSDATFGQFRKPCNGKWHTVPSTINALHSAFGFKVALGQMSRKWYLAVFRLLSWTQGKKDLDMFTSVAIHQVRRRLDQGCELGHTDFFERVLLDRQGEFRELPFMELVSEAIVLLNAGSDTTSSSLTSLVYEVARNQAVQHKLQRELDQALGTTEDPARFNQVNGLPYLKACLDENLRLNPPIPYGPPRIIVDPKGVQIAGQHIRSGTTVSVPTYSIQRREDLFPDPLAFRPERWLDTSDEGLKEQMQKAFVPFSVGPRSCLGRNLAMMEQQVLIATLFHRYEFHLGDPSFIPKKVEAFNLDPGPLPVVVRKRVSSSFES